MTVDYEQFSKPFFRDDRFKFAHLIIHSKLNQSRKYVDEQIRILRFRFFSTGMIKVTKAL